MTIEANLREVQSRIARACERARRSPDSVALVAITKTVDSSAVREAFRAGIRHFGENRVQEAKAKIEELKDIRSEITWHMVGHLQTNKVKTATALFDIIQSVDSVHLAESVSRHARKTIPILLEVNIADESTKSGFRPAEVPQALEAICRMPGLEVKGLMTVAPMVTDPEVVRPVFRRLRGLRDSLGLEHLSMGMTDDFEVAIEEGATMVRIGRAIFGERRVQP
ncbi:MAG: YggS family pyridoxal phosphate-dependent enzyme [Chloroflexi bacterium]|nr:YggS family pyridoxal phosphate-dependent enzyme [Chloroflexota bacterium]